MVMIFNPLWVVRTRMALQGAETLHASQPKYTGISSKSSLRLMLVSVHLLEVIIRF